MSKSSVSPRLWWCWLGLYGIVLMVAAVDSCNPPTCGFPGLSQSQRSRRMTPFVIPKQATTVSGGSTTCSTNCTVQPHLPCTITSSVGSECPYEPATPPTAMAGPPEGLTITLSYNTSNSLYTDVLVEFSVPQGTYMNLDGFIVQETTLQGESGNTHLDQCHHFDLSQAQWTDSDSQTTFQESCGSYEDSSFYMVKVHSIPRPADDPSSQEAMVSIKPRYKDDMLPDRMRIQMVIYADSCSRTVRVAFLQALDAHQFQSYDVRLMPDSSTFPCSCTTVSHTNGQGMQEATFHEVPIGTYYAQVQGSSTTSCQNHCLATNSAKFSIIEDPPYCSPDVPAFETTVDAEMVSTADMTSTPEATPVILPTRSSKTVPLAVGLGLVCGILAVSAVCVLYKWRQHKKKANNTPNNLFPGQSPQQQGPRVCAMYPDDPRVDVASLLERLPGSVERMVVEANKPIVKTDRIFVEWLNMALSDGTTPVIIVCPAVFAQSAESIFDPDAAAAAAAAEDSGSRPEDADIVLHPHVEQPPVDVTEEEPIITACRHIKEQLLTRGQNSQEFNNRLRLVSFEIEPVLPETDHDHSGSTTEPKTTPSTNPLSGRHQSSMLFSLPSDIDQLVEDVSRIQSFNNNNNPPSVETDPSMSMFTLPSQAHRCAAPKCLDGGTIATTESVKLIRDHICDHHDHLCNYQAGCPSLGYQHLQGCPNGYSNGFSHPVNYGDNAGYNNPVYSGNNAGYNNPLNYGNIAGYNNPLNYENVEAGLLGGQQFEAGGCQHAGYSNPVNHGDVELGLPGGQQVHEGAGYNAEPNLQEANFPEMNPNMTESSSDAPFTISSSAENKIL